MYWRTGQALLDQMEEATRLAERYEHNARRRREIDLEAAKILKRMEEIDGWRCVGAESAADFGERRGVQASAARNQLGLGRAIQVRPALEEEVRTGEITVDSGALLGQVLTDTRLQREGDDWIGWAKSDSTRAFLRRVQQRKEEVAQAPEDVIPIRLHVTERALEDFHRAKAIASRKAGKVLTDGQTFATLGDTYLDVFDEERVKPGKRRMPHTSLVPGRHVPAEVKREVAARSSGGRQRRKCAVPYCDHQIFLEKAHVLAHRRGGSREADNIVEPCTQHHDLLDAGYVKLTGTAEDPRFTDRAGNDLSRRIVRRDEDAPRAPPPPEPPQVNSPPPQGEARPPSAEKPPGTGPPQNALDAGTAPGTASGPDPP